MSDQSIRRTLPPNVISRGEELAKDASYYGIPLVDMTREELLAVAALSMREYFNTQKETERQFKLMRELREAARRQ